MLHLTLLFSFHTNLHCVHELYIAAALIVKIYVNIYMYIIMYCCIDLYITLQAVAAALIDRVSEDSVEEVTR